jgi:ubiquinone/menaquinone biosynthesis C-methylase UbiE
MPCSTWLIWFLETPYTEAFASSKTILDRLDLTPGMRVFDVGAGPGCLSIPIAKRVGSQGEVVSLDIQPGMLHKLQHAQPLEGSQRAQGSRADTLSRMV